MGFGGGNTAALERAIASMEASNRAMIKDAQEQRAHFASSLAEQAKNQRMHNESMQARLTEESEKYRKTMEENFKANRERDRYLDEKNQEEINKQSQLMKEDKELKDIMRQKDEEYNIAFNKKKSKKNKLSNIFTTFSEGTV